jgi:nitrogen fixation NifU-like protein
LSLTKKTDHIEHFDEAKTVIPPGARFWRYTRAPRQSGVCGRCNASATGVGSCGDKVRIDLHIENQILVEVGFKPEGCVYTLACASALSTLARGRTIDEALELQPEEVARELDGLPDDHMHCARLAVNTLGEAIAAYYGRGAAGDKALADTNQKGR